MENLRKCIVLILIMVVVSSCLFDRRPKNVDPFYTTRNFGQFPVMPLVKPVKLLQDDQSKEWGIDMLKYPFNHIMDINNLTNIGVDSIYIYGKTNKKKWNLYDYKKGEFVYAKKYTGISISESYLDSIHNIQIKLVDSINNTFYEPERWFVINVADSTIEAFFSETKYKNFLGERGVSGKMFNINKYHKQFKETGILPWFPDSVKVKLKK